MRAITMLDDPILVGGNVESHPLQPALNGFAHLILRHPLTRPPGEGDVLDGLLDLRPKLAGHAKLAGQVTRVGPCHVAADDLGLMLAMEDVVQRAAEAGSAADLRDHGSASSEGGPGCSRAAS
jgi:hypothetical protein